MCDKNKKPDLPMKKRGGGYRIGYIDALKGFAILCVVFGHICMGYIKSGMAQDARAFLVVSYAVIYTFHMPLFMMISGYVYGVAYYEEKNGDPRQGRIYLQVLNLLMVYVLFSVLFGIFKIVCSNYVNSTVSVKDILLIWAKPIEIYWYLYVLIIFYLVFSVKKISSFNSGVVFCILLVSALIESFISFDMFALKRVMSRAIFFYIGFSYKRRRQWVIFNKVFIMANFIIAIVFCMVHVRDILQHGDIERMASPVMGIVMAMGISLALWDLFEHSHFLYGNSILKTLGQYSLEIYVSHIVVEAGLRLVFRHVKITNGYLSIFLNLLLTVAIPVFISLLCKKIKIHGLLFKPATYIKEWKAGNI